MLYCIWLWLAVSNNVVLQFVTESVDAEMVWHGNTLCDHPDTLAIKFV